MPVLDHIHIYEHIGAYASARRHAYRCLDPDCTYTIAKEILIGKRGRCPICKNEFILTLEDLKRKLPRCISCSNTKKNTRIKDVESELANLFTPPLLQESQKSKENA